MLIADTRYGLGVCLGVGLGLGLGLGLGFGLTGWLITRSSAPASKKSERNINRFSNTLPAAARRLTVCGARVRFRDEPAFVGDQVIPPYLAHTHTHG